jgi:hypothetical protein
MTWTEHQDIAKIWWLRKVYLYKMDTKDWKACDKVCDIHTTEKTRMGNTAILQCCVGDEATEVYIASTMQSTGMGNI